METCHLFFIVYFFLKVFYILSVIYFIFKNKPKKIEFPFFTKEQIIIHTMDIISIYVFVQWISGNININ